MKHCAIIAAVFLAACGTDGGDSGDAGDSGPAVCPPFDDTHWPTTVGTCDFGVENPSQLVLTTSDFSNGAVSVLDIANRAVDTNVIVTHSDAVPFYNNGDIFVLRRFGSDAIDRLTAGPSFSLVSQIAVSATDAESTNPQSMAFAADGRGFVTTLQHPEVQIMDFTQPPGAEVTQRVDLSAYADDDGNPEAGLALACGDIIFVSVQRLQDFARVDCDLMIAINTATGEVFDAPLPLLGAWPQQARRDPADSSGRTALLLTSGIERVDLATGTVEWAVDESLFSALGIGSFNMLGFDLSSDGTSAYVAAANEDFTSVSIYRVPLTGTQAPEEVITGLNAFSSTLEIVADELWFGDATMGQSGMRGYDLTQDPPTEFVGPLSTGLAPYSVVAIP